jgi:hypothetical protein
MLHAYFVEFEADLKKYKQSENVIERKNRLRVDHWG